VLQVQGDSTGYDAVAYSYASVGTGDSAIGDSFTLQFVGTRQSEIDQPLSLTFGIEAEDIAGNVFQVNDAIQITAYPQGTNLVSASSAADLVIGTGEVDVFEWSLADQSTDTQTGDVIQNFNAKEDSIDLGDLIPDSVLDADLSNYISVTSTANADTVIQVKDENQNVVQTITVEGVDLTALDLNGINGNDSDDMMLLLTRLRDGTVIDPN